MPHTAKAQELRGKPASLGIRRKSSLSSFRFPAVKPVPPPVPVPTQQTAPINPRLLGGLECDWIDDDGLDFMHDEKSPTRVSLDGEDGSMAFIPTLYSNNYVGTARYALNDNGSAALQKVDVGAKSLGPLPRDPATGKIDVGGVRRHVDETKRKADDTFFATVESTSDYASVKVCRSRCYGREILSCRYERALWIRRLNGDIHDQPTAPQHPAPVEQPIQRQGQGAVAHVAGHLASLPRLPGVLPLPPVHLHIGSHPLDQSRLRGRLDLSCFRNPLCVDGL